MDEVDAWVGRVGVIGSGGVMIKTGSWSRKARMAGEGIEDELQRPLYCTDLECEQSRGAAAPRKKVCRDG